MLGGGVKRDESPPLRFVDTPRIVATYTIVSFITVFFLPERIGDALTYLAGIFTLQGGAMNLDGVVLLAICMTFVMAFELAQRLTGRHDVLLRWPATVRGLSYGALILWLMIWIGGAAQEFIYFQF